MLKKVKIHEFVCRYTQNNISLQQINNKYELFMSTWTFNRKLLTQLSDILDISFTKIAERCGLTQQVLSRYVTGEIEVSLQVLIQLCNGLRMPINYFVSENGKDYFPTRETATIAQELWKPIEWNATVIDSIFGDGAGRIYWKDVSKIMGVSSQKAHPRFLLQTRFPITVFLSVCSKFDISPFTFLIDSNNTTPNLKSSSTNPTDLYGHNGTKNMPYLDLQFRGNLVEDYFSMRKEMDNLRKQLIETKYELNTLQQKQNSNDITKKVILAPVTWFYGIRFDLEFDDMSEPVLAWFKMLVKKEYPYYEFFFAKTGSEYNSVRFYTEEGIIFFEAGCESDLANYLFRERIMVGKIWANVLEDNPNVIEFKADLVANARDDREDTAELVMFRKKIIQKFG